MCGPYSNAVVKVPFHANVSHMPVLCLLDIVTSPGFVIEYSFETIFSHFQLLIRRHLQVALHFMSEYCLTVDHHSLFRSNSTYKNFGVTLKKEKNYKIWFLVACILKNLLRYCTQIVL